MKKNSFFFFFLIFSLLSYSSCKKEHESNSQQNNVSSKNEDPNPPSDLPDPSGHQQPPVQDPPGIPDQEVKAKKDCEELFNSSKFKRMEEILKNSSIVNAKIIALAALSMIGEIDDTQAKCERFLTESI